MSLRRLKALVLHLKNNNDLLFLILDFSFHCYNISYECVNYPSKTFGIIFLSNLVIHLLVRMHNSTMIPIAWTTFPPFKVKYFFCKGTILEVEI